MQQRKNQGARPAARPEKKKGQELVDYKFPLSRINFIIIGAAIVLIVIGFALIAGGATTDGSFNPEVFNNTRLIIGPTLAFIGFIAVGVGIMWGGTKPADATESEGEKQ
ncbi:MAG: DUF3098 domain-containing protein [Bacteroides sp.]|nr:DUF3098 domain-containing protein [Bacteroides sp.]MCM1413627.1 DUF3098 domain-containing protein [Bacteroides sp.]MCM1471156.1 DUF3098 domain-containing protein [Bacteroides sp.]